MKTKAEISDSKAIRQGYSFAKSITDQNPELEKLSVAAFGTTRMANFVGEKYGVKYHLCVMIYMDENMIKVNTAYAICSPDDTYNEEVGVSLAMGRAMQLNGSQTGFVGGTSPLMIASYVKTKQSQLEDYMEKSKAREYSLQAVEESWNSELAELAEDLR